MDVIIPVILGACAVGFALMAIASRRPPKFISTNEAMRHLVEGDDAPISFDVDRNTGKWKR